MAFVARMKACHRCVPAGKELIAAGQTNSALYTLYDGWAMRVRTLLDGTRQILDFVLPGDLIGLPSALLGASASSVHALTAITVC